MKCDDCIHMAVCSLRKNMIKLDAEVRDKTKLIEFCEFNVDVGCKYYLKSEPKTKVERGLAC